MNKLKAHYKTILFHIICSLILIGLSCISLIFNEWIVIINMTLACLLSFTNILLFIASKESVTPDGMSLSFGIFTFARFALMFIGIVLSAVFVYLTMPDTVNNLRYFTILLTAIPYFMNVFALLLEK